jgi:hypothetical protein
MRFNSVRVYRSGDEFVGDYRIQCVASSSGGDVRHVDLESLICE